MQSEQYESGDPGSIGPDAEFSAPPPGGLRARQAGWLLFLYVVVQIAGGILVGAVAGLAFVVRGGDTADAEAIEMLTSEIQTAGGAFGMLLGGLAVLRSVLRRSRHEPAIVEQVGLYPGSPVTLGVGLVIGAAIATTYLFAAAYLVPPSADFLPGPITQSALVPGLQQNVWIFIALVLAPPVEELVYRGALYAGFARSWGMRPAAFMTTFVFVLTHIAEIQSYWPAAVSLSTLAMAALALRLRTGAIGPAITAHLGYNVMIVAAVRFAT